MKKGLDWFFLSILVVGIHKSAEEQNVTSANFAYFPVRRFLKSITNCTHVQILTFEKLTVNKFLCVTPLSYFLRSTPQFHTDPLSSTHRFNTRTTPFQHPKFLSSTPKTPQFHLPLSCTPKPLSSTPKTP